MHEPEPPRKIIHIDMDAFFASVEQRDRPELRGKPVAVGGSSMRGVVAAASYEARKFGVRSAMPSVTAARLCPDLIFVKGRFEAYSEVSRQIRAIFREYTDLVEPLSLDEAFLDVTEPKKGPRSATLIAEEIRRRIFEETQLTASAGVSFNKFLAKMASDVNKPNGLKAILPDEAEAFLENLPIEKFFGIGRATAERMKKRGIFNGKDLKKWPEIDLARQFGKMGRWYFRIVRGDDPRRVQPHRVRKSIGAERTFFEDTAQIDELKKRLEPIAEEVFERCSESSNFGKTLTVKFKTADFQLFTRSRTFSVWLDSKPAILAAATELLAQNHGSLVNDFSEENAEPPKIRLLGVSVSGLQKEQDFLPAGRQLRFDF